MRIVLVCMFHTLLLFSLSAQKIVEASCDQVIEGEFTNNRQMIEFRIDMEAGDQLGVFAKGKFGELIKMVVTVNGPSGIEIIKGAKPINLVQVKTPVLPATGTYVVRVHNYLLTSYYSKGNLGPFIVEFMCKKRKGGGNQPSSSPVETETRPVRSATPQIPSNVFSIPTGARLKAKIDPGKGQVLAFESEIKARVPITLRLETLSGDTPVSVIIMNKTSQEKVFEGSLRYSKLMENTLVLPQTGTYLILLQEEQTPLSPSQATQVAITLSE